MFCKLLNAGLGDYNNMRFSIGTHFWKRDHQGDYAQQEANPVRGIFGAHERHEARRLPTCLKFRKLTGGGRGLRGGGRGKKEEWMGCFLEDLRDFDINADQYTTAAQDEGGWRKTVEQGAECFMAKWIAIEKVRAGLRGMQ